MKVILVDICAKLDSECPLKLVEGDIYNVINTFVSFGIPYHELSECVGWGHYANGFIPLSNIDETATKELINQPSQLQEV